MPTVYAPVPRDATAVPAQSSDSSAALLDAEKLVCYRLAVEFQTLATRLVPRQRGVLLATLRDQLDRAPAWRRGVRRGKSRSPRPLRRCLSRAFIAGPLFLSSYTV